MRVTNNMIMGSSKTNINGNKVNVDKYNTQMTTQKKISKASEDPVIAIRSLRLSTTMAHITQFTNNNIPDAESWMDVTYTALNNIKDLLTDIRTQCVQGATDTLTTSDRHTILKNLHALQDQVYSELNADYADRTVFTGYRTNDNITFEEDTKNYLYNITETFSADDLKQHRYYSGEAEVPTTLTQQPDGTYEEYSGDDITRNSYYRVRLAYDNISGFPSGSVKIGNAVRNVVSYESQDSWMASGDYPLAADASAIIVLRQSGEIVISDDLAKDLIDQKGSITLNYDKRTFDEGELKPEYYFDCTRYELDEQGVRLDGTRLDYKLEDQPIDYTIAFNTTLTVNTQARDIANHDINRDIDEMIDAITYANNAEAKVTKIKEMMQSEQYANAEAQKSLQTYLDVAQKELDYANDNVQKLYENYIGNFDRYLTKVNIGITNVGSMQSRLALTKTRVENQKTTVEDLKSNNEDREMSDIIIDYYAANNAYQSSLTAASKIGKQTLLDYL